MSLPKGVHRVVSRAREYFYFQDARGTASAGPRVRLPNDPQSPEFWLALRDAQGGDAPATFGAVVDAYEMSPQFRALSPGTQDQYTRALKTARALWADLPADGLRPVHVRHLMDTLAETPGRANTVLGAVRALSSWGRARDHFPASLTDGVKPFPKLGGHRPWTTEQIAAIPALPAPLRRAVMLALYTGQRGSDVVRLGPTDIDDGGFRLRQQKTGREVWCPIVSELSAEMAGWEKAPGPFVRQANGKPYTRKLLDTQFARARDGIEAMKGATLHGLRATAVIRLRRAGLSTAQIGDIIGMSLTMIERYCRFADKKASGQAAVVRLNRER